MPDTFGSMDAAALQRLFDRDAIREHLDHFAYCVDDKRWRDWENCFTETATVTFPFAAYEGRYGLAQWGETALAPFQATHHLSSNLAITIAGDDAEVRSKLLAAHVPQSEHTDNHFDIAGTYHWRLVRTPDGWRIQSLRLDITYTNGLDETGLAG
ncbi:nuclear transport factor 2 family protein [Nocardia sp. NPDC004604]|uniref:nuclear transport factor 2 family protein n=1 Tax=Nocardia sp. NPDC004604 TaxID=3157013 RepID=UPI0033B3282A